MKDLIKKIAEFHKDYESKDLTESERIKNKKKYLKSPKEALFFVLSCSFYQGRRDELSKNFEEKAKKVLEEFYKNNITTKSPERITEKDKLQKRYKRLYKLLDDGGVSKEGDRLMVISLINLIQSNDEKNIVCFLIEKIKSGKVAEAYKNLDDVWSIGEKIASLILRDIVSNHKLEEYLKKKEDYYFLQPIDTWVHQVSKKLKLTNKNKDKIYKDEAKDLTNKCFKLGVNPIHYNQGAWYIGSNSLEILLKEWTKKQKQFLKNTE